MLEYIYFIIVVATGLSSFLTRKPNYTLQVICYLLLAYVFAFNTSNYDYDAYYDFYNSMGHGQMEYITNNANTSPLFSYSMFFLKGIGADYNIYRLVMFILLSMPFIVILRNKVDFGIIASGYGLVIFFFDLVQVRFIWAEYLLLIGLLFLSSGKRINYLILLAIGSLFHSMIAVFAVFAFVPTSEKVLKKLSKIAPYFIVGVLVVSVLGKSIIENLQSMVLSISIFGEYGHYLEKSVNYGYLLYVIYQTAGILQARLCYNNVNMIREASILPNNIIRLNYMIQIVGFLFVIPAMLDVNFSRYIRILFIINLITLSVFMWYGRKSMFKLNKIRNLMFLYFIGLNFMWFIGETFANKAYPGIKEEVFTSLW